MNSMPITVGSEAVIRDLAERYRRVEGALHAANEADDENADALFMEMNDIRARIHSFRPTSLRAAIIVGVASAGLSRAS